MKPQIARSNGPKIKDPYEGMKDDWEEVEEQSEEGEKIEGPDLAESDGEKIEKPKFGDAGVQNNLAKDW